jgi:hypothetical protein
MIAHGFGIELELCVELLVVSKWANLILGYNLQQFKMEAW